MNWLLLRGLSREQRHWGPFPEVLRSRLGAGGGVFCLDLPGTGTENGRPSPDTIAGIAADLRSRFLRLREEHAGEWGLLGISLGGMVAAGWCTAHPEDFGRVVIVNSSAGDLSLPWKRMGLPVLSSLVRTVVVRDPVARERLVVRATTRLQKDEDRLAAEWAKTLADRPVKVSATLRQLWAAMRFRSPGPLKIPTLVIVSHGDRLAHPSCGIRLAEHLGAELVAHPDGGHELAADAPEWLADQVAGWSAFERAPARQAG